MQEARINDFVMLITFIKLSTDSIHSLAQSDEIRYADSKEVLEFKVSTQVKSDEKIDQSSIAYQLGLALTESVCNLRTYLKLKHLNEADLPKSKPKISEFPVESPFLLSTERVRLEHNVQKSVMQMEESSITLANETVNSFTSTQLRFQQQEPSQLIN